MHYSFPIGVSTVGRVTTPSSGKEIFIATTTGASGIDRMEALVKNAIFGIVAAKACGYDAPSVGILNIDGARQAETDLKQLVKNGFDLRFAESARSDGGTLMRGNDVLLGTPDVLVCDSLTGNVLMKMLSSFTSGGTFETVGSGYGPGIGNTGCDRLVLIVSRASGAPVIASAIGYAAQLARGKVNEVAASTLAATEKAGLSTVLASRKSKAAPASSPEEEISAPPAEPVLSSITGIEVMDIEEAVTVLWKNGIYAESGMGCSGPLVMMSDKNHDKSLELLIAAGYVGEAKQSRSIKPGKARQMLRITRLTTRPMVALAG